MHSMFVILCLSQGNFPSASKSSSLSKSPADVGGVLYQWLHPGLHSVGTVSTTAGVPDVGVIAVSDVVSVVAAVSKHEVTFRTNTKKKNWLKHNENSGEWDMSVWTTSSCSIKKMHYFTVFQLTQ